MSSNAKDSFFSQVDEQRAKDTENFIAHMKKPREEVEAPDFDIPGLIDEEDENSPETQGTSPKSDHDALLLEYTSEQLWSAELILFKVDEVIAWILSIFTGEAPDKYRKRKSADSKGDDREVQLAAALLNKYQMKMSLEWAFISLFVMGYAPVVIQATQDAKKKKKKGNEVPTPSPPKPEAKKK
jgi:hypothetical protein